MAEPELVIPTQEELEAMTDLEKIQLADKALDGMKGMLLDEFLGFLDGPDTMTGIQVASMMAEYLECFTRQSMMALAVTLARLDEEKDGA